MPVQKISSAWGKGLPIWQVDAKLYYNRDDLEVIYVGAFENISKKTIVMAQFEIRCHSGEGEEIKSLDDYYYRGLNTKFREVFGGKEIVRIHSNAKFEETFGDIETLDFDKLAKSLEILPKKIEYEDGSQWENLDMQTFDDPPELKNAFKYIVGLTKNEKAFFNAKATSYLPSDAKIGLFVPERKHNFWVCNCGEFNLDEDLLCIRCGKNIEMMEKVFTLDGIEEFIPEKKEKKFFGRRNK